jgi:regulator of RNase E activity RraA
MVAAIKALGPGMRILGHARTASTMIGDNSTLHVAVGLLDPGDILVVDAGGVEDIAVWGGVMTEAALARGVGGAVIDGAIRDAHDLRERGFPVFCRAVSPRGPHKGLGGTIDGSIAAGGVPVVPGDIVIGDADGIAVVPLGRQAEILAAAQKILGREEEWLAAIRSGRSTADLLGLPAPEWVLS